MGLEYSTPVQTNGRFNRFVARVLQSRYHWVASRWFCLVRYEGRRSGRRFCTPTQYVADERGVVIVVGRPEQKSWWRNFSDPAGRQVEILIASEWRQLVGRALVDAEDPAGASRLVDANPQRFPRSKRPIAGASDAERVAGEVFVHCTPAPEACGAAARVNRDRLRSSARRELDLQLR